MNLRRTVSFSKQATNIFFHLLTRCNLRCAHCYINPEAHGSETLSYDVIRRWLSAFADRAAQGNLVLLGGEPTLHPDLHRVVRLSREMGFQSVTIDTNGYLFHEILEKVTPEEVDALSFSLDGATPAVNDAIRGEGVYKTCVEGIRRAAAKGFSVSLIYTVSSRNLHELERMPEILADLGVRRFFIQVIGIRGKSADAETALQVDRDRWNAIIPEVAEETASKGITAIYPKVFLAPGEMFECAGICADNYFIFPNGRIYRCPLCEDYPIHALAFRENRIMPRPPISEADLFHLQIPEGCVMNRLVQPDNIIYGEDGAPAYRIACCMLKEEVRPAASL